MPFRYTPRKPTRSLLRSARRVVGYRNLSVAPTKRNGQVIHGSLLHDERIEVQLRVIGKVDGE
jgi:hypothetical protein